MIVEVRYTMIFNSLTENSSLKKFEIFGYFNGEVAISIEFQKNITFEAYLLADEMFEGFCVIRTPDKLKEIFRIIALNNEIPAEQLNPIREIVERGSCDPVPRLPRSGIIRV
jgi:hypothetical protein